VPATSALLSVCNQKGCKQRHESCYCAAGAATQQSRRDSHTAVTDVQRVHAAAAPAIIHPAVTPGTAPLTWMPTFMPKPPDGGNWCAASPARNTRGSGR
jgi:hypothetical protein